MAEKPILAVCGKGGVGKTALSALLARVLMEEGVMPLLLIDADPAGGLFSALGERPVKTLAGARAELIEAARRAGDEEKKRLADSLDYLVLQALVERSGYSLLAMGRDKEKGCYCPANSLLREAIDLVSAPFAAVLIDAEAGLEQINRQVTRRVNRIIAVHDGSARSSEMLRQLAELTSAATLAVIANRGADIKREDLPPAVQLLGTVPEDPQLREYDRQGRSLWQLPANSAALQAVRGIAVALRARLNGE